MMTGIYLRGGIVVVLATSLVIWAFAANATDCPPNTKACKVVLVTPEEEATLTGPNGVFDQAEWANRSGMSGLVKAWRDKIAVSPAGTVKVDPKPEGKK